MTNSILNSVKKVLGIEADYDAFDVDIMMHINSTLSMLSDQLGVGPVDGFMIEDDVATWDDFLSGDRRLNPVKTYVCLKVRQIFDPPATSFVLTAMEKQIAELEWRLSVTRENAVYGNGGSGVVIPPPPPPSDGEIIFDGGAP